MNDSRAQPTTQANEPNPFIQDPNASFSLQRGCLGAVPARLDLTSQEGRKAERSRERERDASRPRGVRHPSCPGEKDASGHQPSTAKPIRSKEWMQSGGCGLPNHRSKAKQTDACCKKSRERRSKGSEYTQPNPATATILKYEKTSIPPPSKALSASIRLESYCRLTYRLPRPSPRPLPRLPFPVFRSEGNKLRRRHRVASHPPPPDRARTQYIGSSSGMPSRQASNTRGCQLE